MGSWLDKLARSSAPADLTGQDTDEGFTRRDALRRAGIIGAAVVAVPMMDSVLSPAFASTSGGGGGTCTTPSDPASMCGGPSANCPRCGFGKTCGSNGDCISKSCVEAKRKGAGTGNKGTCGPSPDGGLCYENNDCLKGSACTGYNANHIGTCQPKPSGGTPKGGACTADTNCQTGLVCLNGKCASKPKK